MTWFRRRLSKYLDELSSPRIFPRKAALAKLLFLRTIVELAYDVKFGVFYSLQVSSNGLPFLLPPSSFLGIYFLFNLI